MSSFTEKAIIDTFISLLNQKALDKITIKDLVDECGVNRSTFYYYFEDIYDLLNKVFKDETKKALETHIQYDSWADGFLDAISFAMQNKTAIYHIYNSVSREQLELYLYSVVDGVMKYAVDSQAKGIPVSDEDKSIACDVYKFMLVGLILDWIGHGMKSDAKHKLERLSVMLEGGIKTMLTKAADKK